MLKAGQAFIMSVTCERHGECFISVLLNHYFSNCSKQEKPTTETLADILPPSPSLLGDEEHELPGRSNMTPAVYISSYAQLFLSHVISHHSLIACWEQKGSGSG